MAASLSYRSCGSVGSTAARSAGRGAAVRAPIAAAARPASSSSTSAAVVAAAALLRRSSQRCVAPPPGALLLLACVSPCSVAAMNALSRTCWVESLAFRGSLRVDIGTAFWNDFVFERERALPPFVGNGELAVATERAPFFIRFLLQPPVAFLSPSLPFYRPSHFR